MPAFRSLTFKQAKKNAHIHATKNGVNCFVYHVWDTDTQPGGGFDWCAEKTMNHLPEVKEQDIVYHTAEGHYE